MVQKFPPILPKLQTSRHGYEDALNEAVKNEKHGHLEQQPSISRKNNRLNFRRSILSTKCNSQTIKI
jgi:hypothetical protein